MYMDKCKYVCMYVCMHACMYVCIYVFFYVFLQAHPPHPSFGVEGLRPWQGLHVEGLSRSWCRYGRERTLGHLGLKQDLAASRGHGSTQALEDWKLGPEILMTLR